MNGSDLFDLTEELAGLVFNSSRHSLQVLGCDGDATVVANLPLQGTQLADFLERKAFAEAQLEQDIQPEG
ncbi:MAG TPA: hypothetical protein VKA63_07455 [Candidatus Krumholzibacteria bacterium]|nr:hypothetical protein [Candidatus Krumholzibacteria bacterium]